jgi:glutathione S-transferase
VDRDTPGRLTGTDGAAVRPVVVERAGPRVPCLFAESFAPWCEKARWALDHHGVAYRWREHVPFLGELSLRLAARRWRGKVTVPLLVGDGLALMDSLAIARYAERVGRGAPLFPRSHEEAVGQWNTCSEALMVAGRALLLMRMLAQPAALREQLPPAVPPWLRPRLAAVGAFGVRCLARKYGVEPGAHSQHDAACHRALDALRDGLRHTDTHLVEGRLSFADIAMATALQFILPVADRFMPLGPATRVAWTHAALVADYPDLLAWRDRLYAGHRVADAAGSGSSQASSPVGETQHGQT